LQFRAGFLDAILPDVGQSKRHGLSNRFNRDTFRDPDEGDG
jgi:hypothetical protein